MIMMKGRAVSYGAISVINAIPSGKGVTLGVDLKTVSDVKLIEGAGEFFVTINGVRGEQTLARETIKTVLERSGFKIRNFHGRVDTFTEIPIGVGLKSSSSSALAIAIATCSALGIDPDLDNAIKWSCEASLRAKKSITGSLDDAAACAYGGLNITDNLKNRIISRKRFEDKFSVLIYIPEQGSRRKLIDIDLMRSYGKVMHSAFNLALAGDVWSALTINGMIISILMGYDCYPSIKAIQEGALGSGLSGTGPAVSAIFSDGNEGSASRLALKWQQSGGLVLRTRINNKKAQVVDAE